MTLLDRCTAYYKFEQDTVDNQVDEVNGNDAVPFGSVRSSRDLPAVGKKDDCVFFSDSTNDHLKAPIASGENAFGDAAFSISVWFYPIDFVNYRIVFCSSPAALITGLEQIAYRLYYNFPTGKLRFAVGNNSTSGEVEAPVAPDLNEWNHCLMQHDPVANTISIRLNGGTLTSASYSGGSYVADGGLMIGRQDANVGGASTFNFNGLIDEIAIFNDTLTTGEADNLASGLYFDYFGPLPDLDIVTASIGVSGNPIVVSFNRPIDPDTTSAGWEVTIDGTQAVIEHVDVDSTEFSIFTRRLSCVDEVVVLSYSSITGDVMDGESNPLPSQPIISVTNNSTQSTSVRAFVESVGGMMHFSTFTWAQDDGTTTGAVWDDGNGGMSVDADRFNPVDIDIDQWLDTFELAGVNRVSITIRHHDGFSIYPAVDTTRDVEQSTTWWSASGNLNIVSEFLAKARERGMLVGVYYSILDNYWQYYDMASSFTQADYEAHVLAQLEDICTNYGRIDYIFFDGWAWVSGWNNTYTGTTQPRWSVISAALRALQPNIVLVENNHRFDITYSDISCREIGTSDPITPITNAYPGEELQTILGENVWAYHTIVDQSEAMTAQEIVDNIERCQGRRASYAINLAPDRRGLIPEFQVGIMREVGRLRGLTGDVADIVNGIKADAILGIDGLVADAATAAAATERSSKGVV